MYVFIYLHIVETMEEIHGIRGVIPISKNVVQLMQARMDEVESSASQLSQVKRAEQIHNHMNLKRQVNEGTESLNLKLAAAVRVGL